MGAAAFTSALYLVVWDGSGKNLDDKGAVGLLINVALVTAVLIFNWPQIK